MAARRNADEQTTPATEETTYTVAEFLAASPEVFGQSKAVVAGALYGKDRLTKDEAQKLVEAFTKKVVGKEGDK